MTNSERWTAVYGPDAAPAAFARALMADEPEQFKRGYTPDNAAIATAETFALTAEGLVALCAAVGADYERVARSLGGAFVLRDGERPDVEATCHGGER